VVYAAVRLSLAAALIHLWAMPEPFREWWGYGAFFLAATLAQGLFGVALLYWPRPTLALAGLAGNLAVVFLYVLTRTRGVPAGPHVGEVEAVDPLGMSATVAELGVVVLLVTMLEGRTRERALWALLLLGAALWALRLLGFLS